MHICLQPFVEQLVDRVDARRRRTHLGGCPADSRDQARSEATTLRQGMAANGIGAGGLADK